MYQAVKRNLNRFPGALHVSAHQRRMFKVTICDLERRARILCESVAGDGNPEITF